MDAGRHKQPQVRPEIVQFATFLLGEELIRHYENETERRLAVWEMCSALMSHVIDSQAPEGVVEAAVDIFLNDLFERGEYKTSYDQILEMLDPYFAIEFVQHIWPDDTKQFGDYLIICRKR